MQHHARGQDYVPTEKPLLCWEAEHSLLWAHGDPKCQAALKEGESRCKSNIYILSHSLSQTVSGLLAAQVNMEVCKIKKRITILHCRTINKGSQDSSGAPQSNFCPSRFLWQGGSLCPLRRVLWHCCAGAQGMEKQRSAEAGWLFERL